MQLIKQINRLKIYDNTYAETGIPNFRGLSYIVKTPDGRFLEQFENTTDKADDYEALLEAIRFCKGTTDFIKHK